VHGIESRTRCHPAKAVRTIANLIALVPGKHASTECDFETGEFPGFFTPAFTLNPRRPDFSKVVIKRPKSFKFDTRLAA
jgi:hypothetical protein